MWYTQGNREIGTSIPNAQNDVERGLLWMWWWNSKANTQSNASSNIGTDEVTNETANAEARFL
jgi:hypothetical protein